MERTTGEPLLRARLLHELGHGFRSSIFFLLGAEHTLPHGRRLLGACRAGDRLTRFRAAEREHFLGPFPSLLGAVADLMSAVFDWRQGIGGHLREADLGHRDARHLHPSPW